MNKNKKITLIALGVAFVLAFIALFMGTANGLVYKVGGEKEPMQLFDVIFNKDYYKGNWAPLKNQGVMIFGFVSTLIGFCSIVASAALNMLNKANKKVNIAVMAVAIAFLLIGAIIMVLAKQVTGFKVPEGEEGKAVLGAGSICWAIFSGLAIASTAVALSKAVKPNA